MTEIDRATRLLLLALLGSGILLLACDEVSRPEPGQRPTVSKVEVTPDSVNASDLPPEQVQDSVAQIPLTIAATATDPDGRVERVVFPIEPASNPRGTIPGRLRPDQGARYRAELTLGVPAVRDEVYSVRVFAVDNDSLSSNQGLGRLRFVPAP